MLHAEPIRAAIRSLQKRDYRDVLALLEFLPSLYPGGDRWIRRRLAELIDGFGQGRVAVVRGQLAGISIEVPKPDNSIKLCTFYVAPQFRRNGIGDSLLSLATANWWRSNVNSARVTAAASVSSALRPLLDRYAFAHAHTERGRYGRSRDEDVFQWKFPMRSSVFSVASRFAEAMYGRRKLYEYRRCTCRIESGARVWIYEPKPVGLVTGSFVVGNIHYGNASLAKLETDPEVRAAVRAYLHGAGSVTALEVCSPSVLSVPRSIAEFGISRPPQSYCFVA